MMTLLFVVVCKCHLCSEKPSFCQSEKALKESSVSSQAILDLIASSRSLSVPAWKELSNFFFNFLFCSNSSSKKTFFSSKRRFGRVNLEKKNLGAYDVGSMEMWKNPSITLVISLLPHAHSYPNVEEVASPTLIHRHHGLIFLWPCLTGVTTKRNVINISRCCVICVFYFSWRAHAFCPPFVSRHLFGFLIFCEAASQPERGARTTAAMAQPRATASITTIHRIIVNQ